MSFKVVIRMFSLKVSEKCLIPVIRKVMDLEKKRKKVVEIDRLTSTYKEWNERKKEKKRPSSLISSKIHEIKKEKKK